MAYRAPEMIDLYLARQLTEKVDIWVRKVHLASPKLFFLSHHLGPWLPPLQALLQDSAIRRKRGIAPDTKRQVYLPGAFPV